MSLQILGINLKNTQIPAGLYCVLCGLTLLMMLIALIKHIILQLTTAMRKAEFLKICPHPFITYNLSNAACKWGELFDLKLLLDTEVTDYT